MDTLNRRSGPESVASYLHVFGGPYVTVGAEHREIAEGSKRLLALLGLRRGRAERCHAAGLLRPGTPARSSGEEGERGPRHPAGRGGGSVTPARPDCGDSGCARPTPQAGGS